jgi:hypothetical protein
MDVYFNDTCHIMRPPAIAIPLWGGWAHIFVLVLELDEDGDEQCETNAPGNTGSTGYE